MRKSTIPFLLATALAAGCGGGKTEDAKVREGAVVFRDALKDNSAGWLLDEEHGMVFTGGRYQWRAIPAGISPAALPDDLLSKPIPKGVSVSVATQVSNGDALRVVDCRELGPSDQPPEDWYELGVDGKQALIRRMNAKRQPKLLARKPLAIPNGQRVRMTGQCVPDADGGLVLALKVNGREVARAHESEPLPAARGGIPGMPGIRAYTRPDSPTPATIIWDGFELRSATVE
jgi:hypothetical protein